jgi:stage V sporulation protein B
LKLRPNLRNFLYLVGSGLIIQLAGTVYRIWLAREIGAEGLGILQMVYPIYRLLSGLATLGLPLAIIKWISEYLAVGEYPKIIALRKWAVYITLIGSVILGFLLILFAPVLGTNVFTDNRVTGALIIIAFAIPFSSLSAIYRGYFQGYSRMAPTATSEITEQVVEIGTAVLCIMILSSLSPFSNYTAPVTGLTMGEVACFVTLLFFLRKSPGKMTTEPDMVPGGSQIALPERGIFRYAWPLLLNQIILSISLASEGVIIPRLLISSGHSTAAGTGLFGQLTGMAEPVAYFPLIFLAPLGSVLSPQISAAFKTKSFALLKKKIALFYLAAVIFSLFSFFIILGAARFLSVTLYNSITAAPLIRLLLIGLPFTAIAILNVTILSAVGATDKILWISFWSVSLKTLTLVIFTPLLGIHGSGWAINITQIFLCLASMAEARQVLKAPAASSSPRWPRPFRFLKQLRQRLTADPANHYQSILRPEAPPCIQRTSR